MAADSIDAFHDAFSADDRAICDHLRAIIDEALPEAEAKVWHAHPVWFLDGNPVVGYSRLKDAVRLFFWSGQSFPTPGLKASGSFKAAETRYTHVSQIDTDQMKLWLADSRDVQWDYKNIVKRKGELIRLK